PGLPLPRRPLPGQLLRAAGHRSARRSRRRGEPAGGGSRSAVAVTRALLRSRTGLCAGAVGRPLARGPDRVVELVACLPDPEASLALPGRGGRPGDVRDAAGRELPDVAADVAGGGRGERP